MRLKLKKVLYRLLAVEADAATVAASPEVAAAADVKLCLSSVLVRFPPESAFSLGQA